jgi:hypothetical protein
MPGERTFRASLLSRDLRSFALPGLGLAGSSILALAYVLGAGESFSVVAGLLATAGICTGAVAHGRARVRRLAPMDVRLTEQALVCRGAARSGGLCLEGPISDRVRAAKAVLEGEAGYREAHVDPCVVSAILADPTASAADRVAAALALAGAAPGGREKVRVVAQTTADVSVRAAL